jgi:hypothetical protein
MTVTSNEIELKRRCILLEKHNAELCDKLNLLVERMTQRGKEVFDLQNDITALRSVTMIGQNYMSGVAPSRSAPPPLDAGDQIPSEPSVITELSVLKSDLENKNRIINQMYADMDKLKEDNFRLESELRSKPRPVQSEETSVFSEEDLSFNDSGNSQSFFNLTLNRDDFNSIEFYKLKEEFSELNSKYLNSLNIIENLNSSNFSFLDNCIELDK